MRASNLLVPYIYICLALSSYITNTSMNKSLLRKTKMNSASNLKARLLFVLAITFVGNSRLAAGNNQNAGRKLDEIPGEYFFEFW